VPVEAKVETESGGFGYNNILNDNEDYNREVSLTLEEKSKTFKSQKGPTVKRGENSTKSNPLKKILSGHPHMNR